MVFVTFCIVTIILIYLKIKGIPKLKGLLGELTVTNTFEKLQLEGYKIISDLLIINSHGTSQIDHVIICPYGIFVVETKTYRGWIYGKENSDHWTQVIYKSKTSFRNPIKQNHGHIIALREVMKEYKQINYIPIVIFAGSAVLKCVDTKIDVIYPEGLYNTILSHRGAQQLSTSDIENIYTKLNSISLKDRKSRRHHIKNIKATIREYDDHLTSKTCPMCKGKLVLRIGRYGEFIGCSNYPKCKFRQSL